ncbi:MAG: ribosomal protein S18-alanine N-acetyltransferase [Clostridia bacterium]|jgi:ribosomal-protein-alanine N-acetyltransferase|nr:ribosomal protein S18-alanine N-acetyltransferase [Clostridia bacterium]MCI1960285.1 ribosomal protein S18-alanine N-acetyltransferase [Clostridia bacterium]MCI2001276.1 ribosomal protein S18-alanine N-acetyltransferase [Clostridia bacterium]
MTEIVPMKYEDIDDVLKVEEECFVICWTRADFEREIRKNKLAIYFVAKVDGKLAGYAGMWHVVTEGQITNVAVLPEYRGLGIGRKLMEKIIKTGEERNMIGITLEVKISNTVAQNLYTSLGFKPEGFRKNYYKDTNEDAVIMWKYLNLTTD